MSETNQRLARDLAFIKCPSSWPRWPLLPLKSRKLPMSDPNALAFMLPETQPRIYFGIIFMLPEMKDDQTMEDWLKSLKRRDFASFEELLAEYRVD